ncbi:MAG: potassium-transporting ATPase subunit KdpA [Phycisphaeraceae bacterium]|nr:potassium-transporting ATPase subunit KdpA [Phycisphaeraceae bacterium]
MTTNGVIQVGLYLGALLLLAKPLGAYMARVYQGQSVGLDRVLGGVERLIYRLSGVRADGEMTWTSYAAAMLLFNLAGLLAVYGLQRFQGGLPLNPAGLGAVTVDSSFNTAVSFVTNTNWQGYGGETTMSYLTQMLGLTVQNFLSAATGMAVLAALIRGLARKKADTVGNFWVDMTRSTLYILLPAALVLAAALVWQGVPQTLAPYPTVTLAQPTSYDGPQTDADGNAVTDEAGQALTEKVAVTAQTIAVGPVASQVAIKQLGTNGGGFFNVNSAHPLENPTPLSNFLEVLAILLIPAALCYTFGKMVGDTRQGWAVLAAMTILLVGFLIPCLWAEQAGNPALPGLGVSQAAEDTQRPLATAGGNMEGKEVRFGIVNSALWATATTAASNGSVNSMHDSFTPIGGLIPMALMQLGEVIFGGVGSGLYGMLVFVILAVFIAGLMVGRTPEYLGKKIEAFEMKMASLAVLAPCAAVLLGTALAVVTDGGLRTIFNPGAHGFSEVLYAFSSASNNNGSAFAGLGANTPFYNSTLGAAMLLGRYVVMIAVLAIAGSLAAKRAVPASAGTLPTHTPLFVVLVMSVVLVIGALTFVPALALGPIVEHLMMIG